MERAVIFYSMGPQRITTATKIYFIPYRMGLSLQIPSLQIHFFFPGDTHVWFEENEQAGIDLFKVDDEKSERLGAYYLEVNN